MKTIINLFLITTLLASAGSVSMLGIALNDSRKSVEDLSLPIVGQEPGSVKYRTKNGNDLSVTFENDKVVYMENDWLHTSEGSQPLVSNFTFGKTSLDDIRNEYGTNGFTYTNRSFYTTETDLIAFNCFEFDTDKNEVLVTITILSMEDEEVNEDNVSKKLQLQAIIIADKSYLDKIWGKEKVFDENYKKIKP